MALNFSGRAGARFIVSTFEEGLDLLKERGADVAYYDPYVPTIPMTREHAHWAGTLSVSWDEATLREFDAVLIATNHQSINYQELAQRGRCPITS